MEKSDIFNFDASSLLSNSSDMSFEEFTNIIYDKLQIILKEVFKDNLQKQHIKRSRNGLQFACPFCHDSAKDNRKKRGHILLRGNWAGIYKCFNCGESMSISKFFEYFNQPLELRDMNYINKNIISVNSSVNSSTFANELSSQVLNREEAYEYAIERTYVRDVLGLQDISKEKTPLAYHYLINRCQATNYERFLWSEKYHQILILNLIDDRVLGMQIRNIDPNHKGAKYLTMTIDKMRKSFLNDEEIIPDAISKLSCVFNIFNVDFSHTDIKPVLVTEGPFDAFLLPNCIAVAGASKNFDMEFPFWYVYDNDDTGTKHAVEKLQQGHRVFLWKKFKNDYNIPTRNPYGKPGDNLKWDVTDIRRYLRDYKVEKKLYWSPYFSSNSLDGFYIS